MVAERGAPGPPPLPREWVTDPSHPSFFPHKTAPPRPRDPPHRSPPQVSSYPNGAEAVYQETNSSEKRRFPIHLGCKKDWFLYYNRRDPLEIKTEGCYSSML